MASFESIEYENEDEDEFKTTHIPRKLKPKLPKRFPYMCKVVLYRA